MQTTGGPPRAVTPEVTSHGVLSRDGMADRCSPSKDQRFPHESNAWSLRADDERAYTYWTWPLHSTLFTVEWGE